MRPDAAAVAAAAQRSPLREAGSFSALADREELRYREELEPIVDPVNDVVRWIESKQLAPLLEDALSRTGVRPAGTVVDLGAGTCWMSALLSRRAEVSRVLAVEFSRRRLLELAPVAMAYLDAVPEKIERVVADFYAHGLGDGIADLVVIDAAFHHAAEPVRLARVAHDLLVPGGAFLLHREPSLALLRRSRPHGLEGEHGSFEHEYQPAEYLAFLEEAGFEARKVPAEIGFRTRGERTVLKPPRSWLNGILSSTYTYVGRRPEKASSSSRGTAPSVAARPK